MVATHRGGDRSANPAVSPHRPNNAMSGALQNADGRGSRRQTTSDSFNGRLRSRKPPRPRSNIPLPMSGNPRRRTASTGQESHSSLRHSQSAGSEITERESSVGDKRKAEHDAGSNRPSKVAKTEAARSENLVDVFNNPRRPFNYQRRAPEKYEPGMIIRTDMYEYAISPNGESSCLLYRHDQGSDSWIPAPYVPRVCAKLRYAVIVLTAAENFVCLPVCSFGGEGLSIRSEAEKQHHVSIYDKRYGLDEDGIKMFAQTRHGVLIVEEMYYTSASDHPLHRNSTVWLSYPFAVRYKQPTRIEGKLESESLKKLMALWSSFAHNTSGLQDVVNKSQNNLTPTASRVNQAMTSRDLADSLHAQANSLTVLPSSPSGTPSAPSNIASNSQRQVMPPQMVPNVPTNGSATATPLQPVSPNTTRTAHDDKKDASSTHTNAPGTHPPHQQNPLPTPSHNGAVLPHDAMSWEENANNP